MFENPIVLTEDFSLTNFPKELVERILINNPFEDLLFFSETCSSFRNLSWSFWKEKAKIDLKIPGWYFDLYCNGRDSYVNREITGKERYLDLRVMQNPFLNQKFLRKDNRLSLEKAFFFAFFSNHRKEVVERIHKLSDEVLKAYIECIPLNNIFDPCSYRKLLKEEVERRAGNEKKEFSIEEALQAGTQQSGSPFDLDRLNLEHDRITSMIDYTDEKCIDFIRNGNFDQLFHFVNEVEDYREPFVGLTTKIKAAISIFQNLEDPFDLAFQYFELFRKESEDPALTLAIVCQIISTGRLDKFDQFSEILKEKNIPFLDDSKKGLYFGHPSGIRTYAEIFSLFAYYSNDLETIERFSDYEYYSEGDRENYKPLSKEYQIFYLLIGFLRKRNVVGFYRVLSSEDMVWSRRIQILVSISGHREAILYMIKNVPIEKNFPSLYRMTLGDPLTEEIFTQHFDTSKPNIDILNELSTLRGEVFFIENLIDRTCCTNYVEEKLGLDRGSILELVDQLSKCFNPPETPQ
nr:hypothetical protein pmam_251 [Pithovirus mammoth]